MRLFRPVPKLKIAPGNRPTRRQLRQVARVRRHNLRVSREIVLAVGGLAVIAGISLYDWRAGLIAAGSLLTAGALHGLAKG